MSQNNGPISRLVNQGISNAAKPKKATPPRMTPTAADYLLGRAQVPQPPAQAPNPIANQQRQNAQAVRRMSPGIDRVANPSNERRVQIRANTPGTPENTRELVRRQVAAFPIDGEMRAEVEALVDSALFIRTTYLDPETGMRRRVSPLASQNAIRQTGLLDPSDAMEVVALAKTPEGRLLLKTEVEQFRAQRGRGQAQARELEALARPGNVDPNIAGVGGVIDTLKPVALGVPSEMMSRAIQNDPANVAGLVGVGEAVVGTFQDAGLGMFRNATLPLQALQGVGREQVQDVTNFLASRAAAPLNQGLLTRVIPSFSGRGANLAQDVEFGLRDAADSLSRNVGEFEPLRMLGVDPEAIERGIRQFGQAQVRGFAGGVSSMTRIPQLLGSKEWADLSDAIDKGVAMREADKPLDQTFFNEIGRTIGGVVPQIAPALLTGGSSIGASVAGRMVASAVFGVTEAATNAAGGFDRAVKEGQNIEEARQRAFRAMPVDAIVSSVLNRFGEFSELSPAWKKLFASSFSEGLQETFQTGLEGYVATGELDFTSPEAIKGGLLGMILGPLMGGGIDLATGTQMEGGAEAVPPQVGSPIQRVSASAIEGAYADTPDYGADLPEGALVGAARWRDTETLRTAIIEDGIAPPPAESGGQAAVNAGYAAQYKRYVDLFNRVSRSTYNANSANISRDTFNKEVELLRDLHIEFWREASRPQPAQRVSANTIERSYRGIDEGPELSAGALVNLAQQFAPQAQPQPVVTPSPAQQPSGARGESAVVETNLQGPQARAKAISESPIPGATEAAWSSGDQRIVVGVERIQDAISRVGTSPSPKEKDVVRLLTTMHKVRARAEAAGVDIDPAGELQGIEARMRDLGYEVDPGFMAPGDPYDTGFKVEVVDHIQAEGELRVHEQLRPAVYKDGKLIAKPQIITTGYSEYWQSPEEDGGNAAQLPPPPDSTLPPTATTPDFPRTAPADMPQPAQAQQTQAPTQSVAQEATQKEPWQMTREEYLAQQAKDFEELVAQSRKKLEDARREDPDSQSIHVLESVLAFQQNVLKDLRRGKDAGPIHLHHRVIVNGNLAKGLPVPPEVLADYPDLAAKYQPTQAEPQMPTREQVAAKPEAQAKAVVSDAPPFALAPDPEVKGVMWEGADYWVSKEKGQYKIWKKTPTHNVKVSTISASLPDAETRVYRQLVTRGAFGEAVPAPPTNAPDAPSLRKVAEGVTRPAQAKTPKATVQETSAPSATQGGDLQARRQQYLDTLETDEQRQVAERAFLRTDSLAQSVPAKVRQWVESASESQVGKFLVGTKASAESLAKIKFASPKEYKDAKAYAEALWTETRGKFGGYFEVDGNTVRPHNFAKDDRQVMGAAPIDGHDWWTNTHIAMRGVPANAQANKPEKRPDINRVIPKPGAPRVTVVGYAIDRGESVSHPFVVMSNGARLDATLFAGMMKHLPDISYLEMHTPTTPLAAYDKDGNVLAVLAPYRESEDLFAFLSSKRGDNQSQKATPQPAKAAQPQESARPQPATTPKPKLTGEDLARAKARKYLESDSGKGGTNQQYADSLIEEGYRAHQVEVVNEAAVRKAKTIMDKAQGRSILTASRAEDDARKVIKDPPKKTEYRAQMGSGTYRVISKTLYDYMLEKAGPYKDEPKPAPAQEFSQKAKDLPDAPFENLTEAEIEAVASDARKEAVAYAKSLNDDYSASDVREYEKRQFPRLASYREAVGDKTHAGYLKSMLESGKSVPDRVLLAQAELLELRADKANTNTKDQYTNESNARYAQKLRDLAAYFRSATQSAKKAPANAPESVSPGVQQAEGSTAGVAEPTAQKAKAWEMTRAEYDAQFPYNPIPPEFQRSKIQEPVYHGAPVGGIKEFFTTPDKTGGNTGARNTKLGAFFSESPDIAATAAYGFNVTGAASRTGTALYQVRINSKKPLMLDNLGVRELSTLEQAMPGFTARYKQLDDKMPMLRWIAAQSDGTGRDILQRLGYDSIVLNTTADSGESLGAQKQYVVFDSGNIFIERETPTVPHDIIVSTALDRGEPVPQRVLAGYPEMVANRRQIQATREWVEENFPDRDKYAIARRLVDNEPDNSDIVGFGAIKAAYDKWVKAQSATAQKQPKPRTQAQQRADAKKRDAALQDLVYGTPGTVIETRFGTDTVVSYDKKQNTVVVSRTENGRNMGQFPLMGGLNKREVVSITAPDGTVLYGNRKLTDAAKERVEAMLAPKQAKKPNPQSPAEPKVVGEGRELVNRYSPEHTDNTLAKIEADAKAGIKNPVIDAQLEYIDLVKKAVVEDGVEFKSEQDVDRALEGYPTGRGIKLPSIVDKVRRGEYGALTLRNALIERLHIDERTSPIAAQVSFDGTDAIEDAFSDFADQYADELNANPQSPDILASPSKPAKSKDTITVDGKERPRTNSNGQPIHPTEEGIRAFWRWFGDSKVVDEQGRPLVVYHGTPHRGAFNAFDITKSGQNTTGNKNAVFFASSPDMANVFAQKQTPSEISDLLVTLGDAGQLIPAYLRIDSPLDLSNMTPAMRRDLRDMVKAETGLNVSAEEIQERASASNADVIKSLAPYDLSGLRKYGYDGLIARVNNSWGGGLEYAALDPAQIKSATGNQGTFSPDNPSILASPRRVRRGMAPEPTAKPDAPVPQLTPAAPKSTPDPRAEARKEAKSGGHIPKIEGWSAPEPKTPTGDLNTIRMALDRVFPRHTYGRNRAGTKGTFNLRTGFTMVGYVSDSVTRVHELAHQIEKVYGLMDDLDADTLSLIDAELAGDAFGQTVPDKASESVERSERFAEWLTAYIEEPVGAAMLAPTVLKVMVQRVPAQARAAIDEFSSQVQGYRNLPPEKQMALRIEDPSARKTFVDTLRGWFSQAFQAIGADGAAPDMAVHRTRVVDGVWRAAVTNTRAPIEGAVLRLAEMQGFKVEGNAILGMSANPDDDLLNSPLHYIASYPYLVEMTKAMLEGGLKNLRNETYTYNGQPLSVVNLLNTLAPGDGRAEQLKSAYAYMFAQRFESLKGRWTAEEQAALETRQAAREAKAKSDRARKERRLITEMNLALSQMQASGKSIRQIATERVKREAEIAKELDALDAKNAKKLASDLKKDYARTREVLRQRFENMGLTPGETLEQIEAAQKAIMDDFNARPAEWQKQVKDFAAQYRMLGDASLDVLVSGGLMNQREADEVRRNNPYWISARRVRTSAVPKLTDADQTSLSDSGASQFFQKTALTGADDGINQFKGSQASIQDPVVSLMQNIFEAYRAAYINKSVGGLVALAEGAGPGAGMFDDITNTTKADSTVANLAPGETVRVYRQVPVKDKKGKPVLDEAGEPVMQTKEFRYIVLDPAMQRAFKGVSRQFGVPDIPAINVALRVLTLPKRLLQWGVVVTPMFKIFNVIRDTAERVVGGRHDRSFAKVFSTRPLNEYEYRSMGIGIERGGILGDRNDYQNMMTSVMRNLNPRNTMLVKAGAPFRAFHNMYFGKFSVWSESVNRTIEYNAALKKAKARGMSDTVAALWAAGEARSTGTDFARHGALTAFFDMFIPFLNPAVQGQAAFWTKAAENPKRFMVRLIMYALIGAGLEELWALKDGTSAARRDLPPYMRYMFWNFHIKGDKWLRIPKGHELGAILALGEEARRGAAGEEMNLPGVGRSMFQTMSPVSDSDIYGPLTTLIQWNANRDFFTGNTIVPEYESKRAFELRDFENSSPLAKLLANITKKDARLWDMAINETFGTVGAIATDASRLAEPDELPMSDRVAGLGGRVFGVVSRQSHTQAPAVVEVRNIVERMGSQDVMRPYRTAYYASTSATERERIGRLMIEEAERILPRLRRITERTPRNEAQIEAMREQLSAIREEVKSVAEIRFGASAR